jgi:hypothetical protein
MQSYCIEKYYYKWLQTTLYFWHDLWPESVLRCLPIRISPAFRTLTKPFRHPFLLLSPSHRSCVDSNQTLGLLDNEYLISQQMPSMRQNQASPNPL